ncbi:MAG: hypothetical protein JOZ59_00795 [Candidatus Eremiobacteraeota bacterium]|nr:hypothetical protein [Candidatus Eremiobacteraeota bacterium]
MSAALRVVWFVQCGYYIATALPAIFSRRFFESVTGPKIDYWLVHMVALLVIVIGVAVGIAAWRRSFTPEIVVLSVTGAASFTLIDFVYALHGTISRVYIWDAAIEIIIIVGVLITARLPGRA